MASPFRRWCTHSSRVGRKDGEILEKLHLSTIKKNAQMERNVIKRLKVGSWGSNRAITSLRLDAQQFNSARCPRKRNHRAGPTQ